MPAGDWRLWNIGEDGSPVLFSASVHGEELPRTLWCWFNSTLISKCFKWLHFHTSYLQQLLIHLQGDGKTSCISWILDSLSDVLVRLRHQADYIARRAFDELVVPLHHKATQALSSYTKSNPSQAINKQLWLRPSSRSSRALVN